MTTYKTPTQGGYSGAQGGYSDPWGLAGSGSVVNPPKPASPPGADSGATPGTYGVNPMDPQGTAVQAATESQDLFTGLKAALFGTDAPDAAGKHGGLFGIGDTPIGDVSRFGAEVVTNVALAPAAGLVGHGLDALGGTLERVGAPDVNSPMYDELKRQFDLMPADSEAKIAALAAMANEGDGPFSAKSHYMSAAVRKYSEELSTSHPDLFAGMISAPGSAADTISNIFGSLGVAQRGVERLIAGAGRPGNSDLNQLQMIMAVGDGRLAWSTGDKDLSPVEAMTYAKVKSGEWSETEALDFISSHGAGLSHDQITQIAGTFATDPLMIGSIGAAGLAKLGVTGAALLQNTRAAQVIVTDLRTALQASSGLEKVELAAKLAKAEQELAIAQRATIAAAGSKASRNVLGQLAESERGTDLVRVLSRPYTAMQDTAFGKGAKVMRTIIDPFHAMDLRMPGAARNVDLMTDITQKAAVDAYGAPNHLRLLETLHDIDPIFRDQFIDGFAVYSANLMRRVVGVRHRAELIAAGLGERLASVLPGDAVSGMLSNQRREVLTDIMEEAQRFRIRAWDESSIDNLAQRLETFYGGGRSADDWKTVIGKLNEDQRSMLHASTYGVANNRLLNGVAKAVREGGTTGSIDTKLHRLVLLNVDSLTTLGAEGIVNDIAAAGNNLDDAIEVMHAAQRKYPELRYFAFDEANAQRSLDRFVEGVRRRTDSLPMQVTDDEIKSLHQDLQDLATDMKDSFTLGFRPEDEYLWGLDRVNAAEGKFAAVGDVWVDHVGVTEAGPGYRAGRYLDLNFEGKPILGIGTGKKNVGRAVTKPVDYINAMGRVMRARVSGTLIAEAARSKFVSQGVSKHGFTESEANELFEAVGELTRRQSSVANPRGLGAHNMWVETRSMVPTRLLNEFDQRDLLGMVLDAYEGDVRFVGVTQKLTGRAKAVIGKTTGVNFLGEVAEHLYPLVKFRLNAIFQVQEKIEPWVLNAQRGAQVAIGTRMSPADVVTQRGLENMVNHSLVRMGDVDQYEYSIGVMHAGNITKAAARPGTKLGAIREFSSQLSDVQGVKRINMLRTFRKGLGKELKSVWEEHSPGVWNDMKMEAQRKLGSLMTDDDFAVQVMAENMLGNDIAVNRILRQGKGAMVSADFKAAIAPGAWSAPQHMGELRPLELDEMARLLSFPVKGSDAVISTQADLRSAIAAGNYSLDEVTEALMRHGADPDYAMRVTNALEFSWEGFWQQAARRFNLSKDESRQLQNLIAASADLRGMTPIDYMSQIFSPTIATEGKVGALGKAVEVMRGGRAVDEADRAILGAKIGQDFAPMGTREEFVSQLASTFAAHLDPSAKKALLLYFQPELVKAVKRGEIRMDLADITKRWAESGDDLLARHLIERIDDADNLAPPPATVDEYVARWPSQDTVLPVVGEDDYGIATMSFVQTTGPVGYDLRLLPQEAQDRVVGLVGGLRDQFPDVPLVSIDAPANLHLPYSKGGYGITDDTAGMTIGYEQGDTVILLSPDAFGLEAESRAARNAAGEAAFAADKNYPRISNKNRPWTLHSGEDTLSYQADVIHHEFGHAVDSIIRESPMSPAETLRHEPYFEFMRKFESGDLPFMLSEYANTSEFEAVAELFSLAFNKGIDLTKVSPKLRTAARQYRKILTDLGYWKPTKLARNPDVERASQMFAKWSGKAVENGLFATGDMHSELRSILGDLGNMPTDGAVPYNLTEARLIHGATDAMTRKWADAFRLQYFSQKRTMLERSINHPMFGIYPASYMWGKIMPEIVKFIADTPFGLKTGAMAYTLADLQRAVSVQREFDPEFDAMVEKIGHGQVLWFLGYMLPSVPWDVSAAWPAWMRDLSQQGLDANTAVANGAVLEQPDLGQSVKKVYNVIDPARAFNQTSSFFDELTKSQEPATPAVIPAAPNTDVTQGPVQGANLGPTLEEQMQSLQDALTP